MPVRPTCQYLIDYVRELINDPSGTGVLTDQQIQDRLDLSRQDVYAMELTAARTLTSTGTIEYHDFYSKFTFWETDAMIQNRSGVVKTADESSYLIGRWHFNSDVTDAPLVVTGRYFDVYGVCSKLLTQIVSELRTEFNFSVDGLTVDRVSQIKNLQILATQYAGMSWGGAASQIKLVRKDIQA